MYKVIFHIDNNDNWKKVLSNVTNLINEFDKNNEEFDIIVLANSSAPLYYLENEFLKKRNKNVTFKACNNSLISLGINKDDLNKSIEIVGAGVYELTVKQNDGYTYIKV